MSDDEQHYLVYLQARRTVDVYAKSAEEATLLAQTNIENGEYDHDLTGWEVLGADLDEP